MKKLKRIIEKQCPMCHNTCYMMVEAENYGTIMEYMVAMYYKTKRKVIQEALPFLNKFGREFILTGYCRKQIRRTTFLVRISTMKRSLDSLIWWKEMELIVR